MSSSLNAGVSGLRAHQTLLDVVGNNLANVNTTAYKAGRATFAELISDTLRAGTAPSSGVGGTNPAQVGLGVRVASIDQDLRQGGLGTTGRALDMAIDGEGFFVVSDGARDLYTRAGAFDLDADHRLVAVGTGHRVQSVDGADIVIDVDARLPARATSSVTLTGNLEAAADAPAPTTLASIAPLRAGTRATITGGAAGPYALAPGMQLTVSVDGGAAQTVTFQASQFAAIGAATPAEVAAAISAQLTGAQAVVSGGGVELVSLRAGERSSLDVNDGTGGPATLLGLSTTLVTGTEAAANLTTPLSDLPQTYPAYVAGDQIHVAGTDADGAPVSATFVVGAAPGQDGTTVGDLIGFLTGLYPGATVALDVDGTLRVTANQDGASPLQLVLTSDAGNTGATAFSTIALGPRDPGSAGAEVFTSIQVHDAQGTAHTVALRLHKTAGNEWEVTASLPDGGGQVLDGQVSGLRFRDDGSFDVVTGVGVGDARLTFLFDGQTAAQDVVLDLGTSGQFDGLTQFGGATTAAASDQDGAAAGALASLSVGPDGAIVGVYTNGQVATLAELQVATFANPGGLARLGDSLYGVSVNSGVALAGRGQSGRAGAVVSGALEESNVDIALEFTKMITAQRGFQVNARTITTTDEMLQEVANLVR